jgi:hypothetical protein
MNQMNARKFMGHSLLAKASTAGEDRIKGFIYLERKCRGIFYWINSR